MKIHAMSSKLKLHRLISTACVLSLLAGCYGIQGEQGTVVELDPVAILPIESAIAIEPSGLCLKEGELYSVSDDTDDMIFKIVRDGESATFEPHIQFAKPEGAADAFLDLEGIISGPGDSFYLLSESFARVLQVFGDGRSEWVTPTVQAEGEDAGLFKVHNGGLEGMTLLDDDHFFFLAERQPRGWIELLDNTVVGAEKMPKTRFYGDLTLTRIPDFTGADFHDDRLYVLFRNGEMVTTLVRTQSGWTEGVVSWSFTEILADDRWGYRDTLYGMAEGLAVDAEYFYVVLDNNQSPRRYSKADTRPLLLILRR
jgi:hypothetical protein|tara:strand:+ start:3010 stop:3945 length:936 start_codon:yes stop_codon:yes gene_type:complete